MGEELGDGRRGGKENLVGGGLKKRFLDKDRVKYYKVG